MSMSKREWFDDLSPDDQWAVNEALDAIIVSNSLQDNKATSPELQNDSLVAEKTSLIAGIMIKWAWSQAYDGDLAAESATQAAIGLVDLYLQQTGNSDKILLDAAQEALNTIILSIDIGNDNSATYNTNTSPQKSTIDDFKRQQEQLQTLELNNLYSGGGYGGFTIITDGGGGHSFLDAHGVANAIPVFNPIPSMPENSSLKEPNKIGTVDWTLLSDILQTMEWPPTPEDIELVQSVAMPLMPGVDLVTTLAECSKTLLPNSREKYMAYSIIATIELDKVKKYQLSQATVKGVELKKTISQEEYCGAIAERVLIMQSQGSVSPIQFAGSHTVVDAMPVNQYSDLNQSSVLNLNYDNMKQGSNFTIPSGNTKSTTPQASFLTNVDIPKKPKGIIVDTGMSTDGIDNKKAPVVSGRLFKPSSPGTKFNDLNGYLRKHPDINSQSTNSKLSPTRTNNIKGGSTTSPSSARFANLERHLSHRLGLIASKSGTLHNTGK